MSASLPAARPGSVTVVVVLTWLVAVLSVLGGVLLLMASDQFLADAGISGSTATGYGWAQVIFGVVTALVAVGLGNGNNLSRALVTLLMVLRLAAVVWAAFALGGSTWWSSVASGVFAVAVLALLWNRQAEEFFRTN